MGLLAAVPTWVYFVIILVTYIATHVLTFDPARLFGPRRAFVLRMGSALLLLAALVVFQRDEPLSLLVALALAVVGGWLSGRSSVPPKASPKEPGRGK